jgi:hypothetical protein
LNRLPFHNVPVPEIHDATSPNDDSFRAHSLLVGDFPIAEHIQEQCHRRSCPGKDYS